MKLYKIAAALLALTLLTGCGKTQEPETTTQPTETMAETMADTTAAQTREPAASGIAVETPYITLYCPEEWKHAVEWEAAQQDESYSLNFRLITTQEPVELFCLVLSPAQDEQGYCLGYLERSNGENPIYVYSVMHEIKMEDWSGEDYTEISYQQERINELILQLHEDPGFHAN